MFIYQEHLYNQRFHYDPTIPISIKLEFKLKNLDIRW